ncbi:AhpD-like protein [Lipomyces japonicus]|uniref:AhpD-like protein n=1 Tax=Lipomyces japonicus TaxID=56871 RepID=UPI0034CF0F84
MPFLSTSTLSSLRSTPLLASSWYYIAAATFTVCNKPEAIPEIFKYAVEHDAKLSGRSFRTENLVTVSQFSDSQSHYGSEDESLLVDCSNSDPEIVLQIAKNTREALLKGAALAGLPKTINSLIQLRNATPTEFREKAPLRGSLSTAEELERGQKFWDQVYGKVSKRVIGQMGTAYPDLAQYALQHVYGPLLSYTEILSARETSFVVIACLIPQDVNPQLKGHLRGGLNNGATIDELMSVRSLSMKICEICGVTWTTEVAKL